MPPAAPSPAAPPPAPAAAAPVPPPPAYEAGTGVRARGARPGDERRDPDGARRRGPEAPVPARRGQWVIALVIVALVVGTAVAAASLLTGSSGTPDVLAWTPADSVTYVEARLDLPGDQQAKLAKVLSAFPGFDDQAAFPTKVNEVLDQLVGKASDGKQSYTADIAPWFGGQLSVSLGAIPTSADASTARFLALASVKDAAKASAWAASTLQTAGATATTETYNGVTINVIKPGADAGAMADKVTAAYAVVGPVLALGDEASVKAAIDTGGKKGLDTNADFKAAAATVTGDRLAFAYVDVEALASAATKLPSDVGGVAVPSVPAFLDNLYPAWIVTAVRADDGGFAIDTRRPAQREARPGDRVGVQDPVARPGGHDRPDRHPRPRRRRHPPQGHARVRPVAGRRRQAGRRRAQDRRRLRRRRRLGRRDRRRGHPHRQHDRRRRRHRADQQGRRPAAADAAPRLPAARRGSSGISVTDETYNGATISTVDLSGIGALAGASGVDVPGGLKLSYAVTDDVVVFGSSTDFVKAVLDAPTGSSLASTDRFKAALGHVDKVNGSLAWLDIAGVRDLATPMLSGDDKTKYETDLKPYLSAIDSLIATDVPGTDIDKGTMFISVVGN